MVAGVASLLLTLAILVAFIGGVRRGAAAIIVIRPICDRLFEQARFDVAGHSLSFGAVLNFIVIGAMLLSVRRISNRDQIVLERAWVPFLLIAFVAVLYSPVQVDGFRKFLTYVSYMAIFVLPFALVKTKASAEHFFRVVILSSVLPVLYGLYQLVSGRDWYQGNRVASTFMHPNIFAFFLLAIVGTVLTLLATNRVRLSPRVRQVLGVYFDSPAGPACRDQDQKRLDWLPGDVCRLWNCSGQAGAGCFAFAAGCRARCSRGQGPVDGAGLRQ